MNHTLPDRTEQTFVIRFWYESDGVTATTRWRGSVQSATSPERRFFASWAEMAGYLAGAAGQRIVPGNSDCTT